MSWGAVTSAAAGAVLISLLGAAPASASPAAVRPSRIGGTAPHAGSTAASNKALVLSFADALFNKADLGVIDQDTDGYIQHNPTVADGPEGLRNLVVFLHGQFPNSHTTFERVIAQGDLVLLQDKVVTVPGTPGQQIIDIYRVEHHKIVEHWDNIQPVPATSVNGHDLFSTLSAPQSSTPGGRASTCLSEDVVTAYFRSLGTATTRAGSRLLAPNLVQHDPLIADGARAANAYYSKLFATYPNAKYTVARVIAQGDLVAVHSHFQKSSSDLGQSVVDIFRVRNGKIVEHWDGIQNVPATSANTNTMF